MQGTVINLHRLGATVRLSDGSLVAVPLAEVTAHHAEFATSLNERQPLGLFIEPRGKHRVAFLARGTVERANAPVAAIGIHNSAFEEQIRRYLKATEEWAPPDRPAPSERHFIRKKRRAAYFEARARGT